MITLQLNKARTFNPGDVVHLRVVEVREQRPGRWVLKADDVTPLPGHAPAGYVCHFCNLMLPANPTDGGLPEGWAERKFDQGSFFVCDDPCCQKEQVCRVCGCSDYEPCGGDDNPCHWVEPDLCSACVPGAKQDG